MPLTVLHVHGGQAWGGVESSMLAAIAAADAEPGLRSVYALAHAEPVTPRLRAAGGDVRIFGAARLSRPLLLRQARRQLARFVQDVQADVLLCHGPWALIVASPVGRAAAIPAVLSLHGVVARTWLHAWAAQCHPALVIANSRFTADSARRVYRRSRTAIHYPAVSAPTDQETLLAPEPSAAPGCAVLLMASRFEEQKGHLVLLDALARLRAQSDWACWITGAPTSRAERRYATRVAARVRQRGLGPRVTFLGERRDVPALLRRTTLLVQPNTGPEAFGVIFVEAMDRQVPVLTCAIGAAPEVLGSTCGRLLAPGDAAGTADAIAELLRDPEQRARMGLGGPSRARGLADPAAYVRGLHATLRTLVG
jgi:glycosyltransferase involved in cell wall biosynthesis